MRVNLIQIGNSKGIRIPRSVIEQCGFEREIEMRVEDGRLILSPPAQVRDGWDEAFAAMAAAGDDALLDPETKVEAFDDSEWTW